MFKTLFIIPYFGKWPFWISFFFKSCGHNEDYSWLIYTDCDTEIDSPSNVTIRKCSFSAYKKLVEEKLSIPFNPDTPYKLCDIKPALAYIHKEEVANYDFVAFGDIDLIYGNLNSFLTKEKFEKYDIISTHSRRISGHLCVMRNESSVIELFKKVPNWQALLSDPNHRHFDEKAFSDLFVKHKNLPDWLRLSVCMLYPLSRRVSLEEAFSTPFMKIPWLKGEPLPNTWYWENGSLTTNTNRSKELAYYHFLYWKKTEWSDQNTESLLPEDSSTPIDCFSISKNGFRTY